MAACIKIPSSLSPDQGNMSIGINSIGFLPICLECHFGFPSQNVVEAHLTSKHCVPELEARKVAGEVWKKKTQMTSALGVSPLRPSYLAAPDGVTMLAGPALDPLLGLRIQDGYKCVLCSSCYTEKKALRGHLRKAHSPENLEEKMADSVGLGRMKLQTIYSSGRLRRYFPVSLNDPIGEMIIVSNIRCSTATQGTAQSEHKKDVVAIKTPDVSDAALSVTNLLQTLTECNEDEDEVRLKSTFVSLLRVDEALKARNLSCREAHSLCSNEPQGLEYDVLLSKDMRSYLNMIPEITLDLSPSVLMWCNIRAKGERRETFRTVSSKACAQYGAEVSQLLKFISRAAHSRPDLIDFATQNALRSYLECCVPRSSSLPLLKTKKKDSDRFPPFHDLLKTILLRNSSANHSIRNMDVKSFFCARCVKSNGEDKYRFHEPWEVTKTLAALQYAISCCAVMEVHLRNGRNQAQNRLHSDIEIQQLREAVMIDRNTVASYVRNTLDIAMSLVSQENIEVSFENCLQHPHCGIIRGTHISLKDLGEKVLNAQSKMDSIITKDLLNNFGYPDNLPNQLNSLRDDLSARKVGFSFLSYQREQEWISFNVSHVLKSLQMHEGSNDDGNLLSREDVVCVFGVNIRKARAIKWLNACQELQHLLLFCMHISSGSPARATELCTLRLRNEIHGMRNMFISQGKVMFLSRYVKTRALKGYARPIPRFPDERTGQILLKYLMIIRPVETALIRLFHGKSAATVHWNRLFVRNGVPFSEAQIRTIVSKSLIFNNVKLLFNDYRGYSVGMVPMAADGKGEDLLEEIRHEASSVGHEQGGHCFEIAERAYARTREELNDLRLSTIHSYRQFSERWHDLLGLATTRAHGSGRKRSVAGELESSSKRQRLDLGGGHGCNTLKSFGPALQNPNVGNHERATGAKKQNRDLRNGHGFREKPISEPGALSEKDRREPSVRRSHNDMVVFESQSGFDYDRLRTQRTRRQHEKPSFASGSTLLEVDPNQYEHMITFFLNELISMMRDPFAKFKSHTQYNVTAAVAEKRDNVFVVMPTGSGKSICVLLPVFMARGSLSTILIVPLVSLAREYEDRAKKFGISVSSKFQSPDGHQADLYIFTPERIRDQRFTQLVSKLSHTKALARVVLDEVHLTLMWSNFRQALHDIRYALLQVPAGIPRVFMSATVCPEERTSILSAHGERFAMHYSMPTVRPNLEFKVHMCDQNANVSSRSVEGKFTNIRQQMMQSTLTLLNSEITKISQSELRLTDCDAKCLPFFRVLLYVMRRQDVEEYSDVLSSSYAHILSPEEVDGNTVDLQVSILHYHAAMGTVEKESMHTQWSSPTHIRKPTDQKTTVRAVVMVCTCAFGTGIDAPNVRLVFHVGGSTSLKDYAQEAGRAGRDDGPARCLILFSTQFADNFQQQLLRNDSETKCETSQKNLMDWMEMRKWIVNRDICRRNWLYTAMDGISPGICMFNDTFTNCDVCDRNLRDTKSKLRTASAAPVPDRLNDNSTMDSRKLSAGRAPSSVIQSVPFYDIQSQPSAVAASLLDTIARCEAFVREFDLLCLPCFISQGQYLRLTEHGPCRWMKRRCLHCHSLNHGCRRCPNKIRLPNGTCFRCGMSYSKGHKVHSEEMGYGNSCKLSSLRDLGWCIWRGSPSLREKLVGTLFDDGTAERYNTIMEGSSQSKAAHLQDQIDICFAQWMTRKTNDIPNLLLLGSWWSFNRTLLS